MYILYLYIYIYFYLFIVLIPERCKMISSIIPNIPDVPHLSFVAVSYPLNLLSTIVFDSVHLLSVIFSQTFKLLALVLLNVVQHLIYLFSTWCSSTSAASAPSAAATPETIILFNLKNCRQTTNVLNLIQKQTYRFRRYFINWMKRVSNRNKTALAAPIAILNILILR